MVSMESNLASILMGENKGRQTEKKGEKKKRRRRVREKLGEQRKGGTGGPPRFPARARRPACRGYPWASSLFPPRVWRPSEERGPAGGGHAAVTGARPRRTGPPRPLTSTPSASSPRPLRPPPACYPHPPLPDPPRLLFGNHGPSSDVLAAC